MVQGPTPLYNAVRVDTATTGQGDITLGNAASDAFLDYTEAGVADETVVTYLAEDGDNFELGRGLYDADYSIQQRDTILVSKISGTAGTAKLTLSGSATVRIVAAAEDFMPYFGDSQPSTPHTLWVRTTDFALFCYYDSATPPGQPGVYVQIGGGAGSGPVFVDVNGNEVLDVEGGTASAVTYVKVNNAATGNNPSIEATGENGVGLDFIVDDGGTPFTALALWSTLSGGTEGHLFNLGSTNFNILEIQNTSSGNGGPYFECVHNSASPANDDFIGGLSLRSNSSTAVSRQMASIDFQITDVTNASEDATVYVGVMSGGSKVTGLTIDGDGIIVGSDTTTLPGAGCIRAGNTAHFWVYWTGNSTTILASHNVSSIDDDSTGDAGVNLTTAFSSNNYAAFVSINDTTNSWSATYTTACGFNVHTAGVVDVLCARMQDGATAAASLQDPDQWSVVGFGVSA